MYLDDARVSYIRALKRSLASTKVYFKLSATRDDIAAANPDAFFYPTRLFIAFIIGVIGVATLGAISVNTVRAWRTSLVYTDTAAAKGIFGGVTASAALFLANTGQELFDSEVDWAFQQVCNPPPVLFMMACRDGVYCSVYGTTSTSPVCAGWSSPLSVG